MFFLKKDDYAAYLPQIAPQKKENISLAICEASSRRTKKHTQEGGFCGGIFVPNEGASPQLTMRKRGTRSLKFGAKSAHKARPHLEALRQMRIPLIELSVYIEYLMSISPPSISPSAITTAQSTTLSTLPASQKNHCCQKASVMRI